MSDQTPPTPSHQPGDEVNGHRLSEQGIWEPIPATSYPAPPVAEKPKKKRRIFMWIFLAVQALFVIWVISGASTGSGQPSDCGSLSAETCNNASDTGTAIGVILIVVVWCFVDFLMAVGYLVYRVAKRP